MDANNNTNIWMVLNQGVMSLNRIVQILSSSFPQVTGNSSTATGGSIAPPTHVSGYMTVTDPTTGAARKVAYYDD